jgi:hypothetical protein
MPDTLIHQQEAARPHVFYAAAAPEIDVVIERMPTVVAAP